MTALDVIIKAINIIPEPKLEIEMYSPIIGEMLFFQVTI